MKTKRDSFIFYRSFYEALQDLPDQQRLEIYDAICNFSLNFQECELQGISSTIFKLIKPQLEANNKRFINGSKPKKSKTEAKSKQVKSKTEANNNVNDNVNNNVNDITKRKEIKEKVAFDECAPSNLDDFRDFLDYWFEHGTNDKKMRFEKEKSFSWPRRWKLWLKNKEKWKKEKSFAKKEKDRRPAYEIIQQVKNGTYGIDN
jgi:hypothetical protein